MGNNFWIIIIAALVLIFAIILIVISTSNAKRRKELAEKIEELNVQSKLLKEANEKLESGVKREQNLKDSLERTVVIRTAEIVEKNRELSRSNEETIALLGDVVEMRDKESGNHVVRVKAFTKILAEQLRKVYPDYGLTEEDVAIIASASVLHDVGKIYISDTILLKPGKLTDEEFEIMKTHSARGCEVLERAPKSWSQKYKDTSMDICHYHHEKWDGHGYPEGLKEDEIPISAQIVSICDCFDALTTKRSYKDAFSVDKAYEMILTGECGQFNPRILRCFQDVKEAFTSLAERPYVSLESTVSERLSNGLFYGLRILLADDTDMVRELNKDILESEGAKVVEATNGREAIEMFENDKFDAVLMDLVMPQMDGIEATKKIRALDGDMADTVPIIILTANGSDSQIDECLEAGADDCMAKPLVVTDLTRVLLASIRHRSQSMDQKLQSAQKLANTDALTGVKNITAYTGMVASLTEEMQKNNLMTFAVLMCDIDDLKSVNDTYGHPMGDVYIRNCCDIISAEFNHSPVYRIGGDEFTVIIRDIDYSHRDRKLENMKNLFADAAEIESYDSGKASVSFGMAVYDNTIDKSVEDVIQRADMLMYENKNKKRGGYRDRRHPIIM